MLTTKHLCLVSIAALSLAAVTPALAGPGVDVMLKGSSPSIADPGITLVAKRPGSPRAIILHKNDRSRRGIIVDYKKNRKVPRKHKTP